jgi:tetratricopeptide (TPR) repeat protein
VNLLIRSGGSWSGRERDVCYRNLGNGQFEDQSFLSGLDLAGDGRSYATLDLDGDGALDLALLSRTAPRLQLWRNQPGNGALLLELQGDGKRTNRDAIGAVAQLETDRGRTLTRIVQAGAGYLSQSSRLLHFALEAGEQAKAMRIFWPHGEQQTLTAVPGRGRVRLRAGEARFEAIVRGPVLARVAQEAAPASSWLAEAVPAPALPGMPPASRTLLTFWASWCPPCAHEMSEWTKAAGQFRSAGLSVVVASVDEDKSRKPVAPFVLLQPTERQIAAWNLFYRHLFDHRQDLGLPMSFLLDEKGRVVKVYPGVTASAVILADLRATNRPTLPFAGQWYGSAPQRNYAEIATAMAEHGLSAESTVYFDEAIARGMPTAEALNNYAGVLLEQGDLEKAEGLLIRTLSAYPRQLDAIANLGTLRLKQGQPGAAREAFRQVLAVQPDDGYAQNGLGAALFATKDLAGALAAFRAAVRLDAEQAEYRYNLGSVLAAAGDYREALRELEAVRAALPDSTPLANSLGILYVETAEPAKGEQEFRRAIRQAPQEESGYLNLAMLLERLGRRPEAVDLLRQLLVLQPQNARALQMMETLR